MATTPNNANATIAALRGNSGPLTKNSGVKFWEFDYNGMPINPRNRTAGGALNPEILRMPDYVPPPPAPPAPELPRDPEITPPVLELPIVTPEVDPEPEVEVIPVPDPEPPVVTPLPPVDPPEPPEDPSRPPVVPPPPPPPDPPKTGTVTVELLDEDTGDFVDMNQIMLGGGDGEPPKVGTVTIEDFEMETPIVPPPPAPPPAPEPVGTVDIEAVDDTNLTVVDQVPTVGDILNNVVPGPADEVVAAPINLPADTGDFPMDLLDGEPVLVYDETTDQFVDISGDDGSDWWWEDQGFSNSFGFNFDEVDNNDPFGWDEWYGDDWFGRS